MTDEDEAILADLLLRWEERRRGERAPAIDELCHAHPHLAAELAHRIEALTSMGWLDEPIGDGPSGKEPTPTQPHPRTLAGRYRLDAIVAEGGFARVWRGWDTELEREVAVKCPKPGRVDSAESFLAEARRVARLTHPGIVPVFDVGREGDSCFIVSQFVEGGNLAELLERGDVEPERLARWMAEVADALDSAHRQGVIHRDIKPANILVDRHDRALLADFGIAERVETRHPSPRGTFRYMSPQQREGNPADPRDDIFSLGIVLGDALARYATRAISCRRPHGDRSTAIAALGRIARRAADRDPTARHPSAAALAEDLRRSQPRRVSGRAGPVALAVLLLVAAVAGPSLLGRSAAPVTRATPVVDRTWIERVASLPAEAQVEEVSRRLVALNDGFNGDLKPTIEEGVVVGIEMRSDRITDIAPLQAFQGLRELVCDGEHGSDCDGRLTDLSPLRGMALASVTVPGNRLLRDLSPLAGMALHRLHLGQTGVSDLRPLAGMPLRSLVLGRTDVTDLHPLAGMPLVELSCNQTRVTDLGPLAGMPLERVFCQGSPVTSLEPLRGAPLEILECHRTGVADIEPLRGTRTLWVLNILSTKVTDLSPLEELPGLKVLFCDFVEDRDAPVLRRVRSLESLNGNSVVDFWKLLDDRRSAPRSSAE